MIAVISTVFYNNEGVKLILVILIVFIILIATVMI